MMHDVTVVLAMPSQSPLEVVKGVIFGVFITYVMFCVIVVSVVVVSIIRSMFSGLTFAEAWAFKLHSMGGIFPTKKSPSSFRWWQWVIIFAVLFVLAWFIQFILMVIGVAPRDPFG